MSNRTLTLLMGFVAFLILVVGIVFVVVLVGGGGDDNASPASSSNGNATAKATSKAASSGGGGGICAGNTLIVPGDPPASLLDPIQVADDSTAQYVVEIFSGLVTLDLNLKVQPDIASNWDVSPDGKTYTFHLRDDVVFFNGKRVTAHDFKYSLERAADPANASPTVVAYLGDIAGLKDKFAGKAPTISGVKDIDDRTLEIDLVQPADFFLAELTYPVAFVVDKDTVEKDRNWTRNPNGTGPFKLAEFSPAEKIRLVRNDKYYGDKAKLDEVDFQLAGGSIITQYQNNELHVAFVPGQEIQAVKDGSSPLAKDYHPIPEMATSYINLNPNKPPFDDPKVREAFALSIDRENINNVLLFGTQRVATSFLPPDMPGHSDSVKGPGYDPDKAKQLLSESKYASNMPRIVMNYGGSAGGDPQLLQAITKGWQDVLGVQVDLQAIDTTAYLREIRKGTFQMVADGWIADYPDPEDFLGKLFASDSPLNYTAYKNADVDNLLKEARVEPDRNKRFGLYNQAEQKILDDAVVIPTFWPVEHLLVKPCVENYPTVSMTVPKYRFIDIKH